MILPSGASGVVKAPRERPVSEAVPRCVICGCPTRPRIRRPGYSRFCSRRCQSQAMVQRINKNRTPEDHARIIGLMNASHDEEWLDSLREGIKKRKPATYSATQRAAARGRMRDLNAKQDLSAMGKKGAAAHWGKDRGPHCACGRYLVETAKRQYHHCDENTPKWSWKKK